MKTDKEGLIYNEDGSLACGRVVKMEAEKKIIAHELRELGGLVGFTKAEAEYFMTIVQGLIKQSGRKARSEEVISTEDDGGDPSTGGHECLSSTETDGT